MDETGLFFRLEPNKTLSTGPVSGTKKCKKKITVALCANADGSHKLKLLGIGKSARARCFIQSAECSQLPPQSEGEDDCHCVQAVFGRIQLLAV